MRFHTTILQGGKTATGIRVPDEVVEALGSGRRPAVTVTINGYTYRSTIAVMGGEYMVGVSAEHRAGAGVAGGDEVDVDLELDTAPREVAVPDDFGAALDAEPAARARRSTESRTATRAGTCCRSPERRQRRHGSAASPGRSRCSRRAAPAESFLPLPWIAAFATPATNGQVRPSTSPWFAVPTTGGQVEAVSAPFWPQVGR